MKCVLQLSWLIASTYCLKREPRWRTAVFLSGIDEVWSLGRPRCLAFTGQHAIEERAAQIERPRVLLRIYYKPSAEYQ